MKKTTPSAAKLVQKDLFPRFLPYRKETNIYLQKTEKK